MVCVDGGMALALVVVRVVVGGTHNCWLSCVAMVLRLSLCRSVCLSVCLYFDLSVCPSVCRSIGLSVCLSACLSVSVWLSLSESLHVGPFLFVSVCRCRSFCVSVVMCTSGSVLCQSLYVCMCLKVFMPVGDCPYVGLSVCLYQTVVLSVCLYVYVCLSVCLTV